MHLAVITFVIFAAWRWADWKNWEKYNSTMLFMVMGNLLYNFTYSDHLLWQLKPDLLYDHKLGEIFYTFIVFPLTAMLVLTNYPEERRKQFFRVAEYVAIYIILEYIFHKYGRIAYKYGWNIWWSFAWDCLMFPLIVLHHKKPLMAYAFAFIMYIAVIFLFPVKF